MIRTEITDDDGAPHWLIVTQMEHARISGELARLHTHSFAEGLTQDAAISDEVLQAVTHHDDGWDEWDRSPRFDAASGKPLSFRELPGGDSLKIWSGSIASAAQIGPLAGWLVASHFRGLLQTSSKECDLHELEDWVTVIDTNRQNWLMQWQRQDPASHTLELAQQALLFLQVVDVMSLWLCSASFRQDRSADQPYKTAEGSNLETSMKRASTTDVSPVQVFFDPWRFKKSEFELAAEGFLAPKKQYKNGTELVAAYKKQPLHWRFTAPC